jgi:hypothetical protein
VAVKSTCIADARTKAKKSSKQTKVQQKLSLFLSFSLSLQFGKIGDVIFVVGCQFFNFSFFFFCWLFFIFFGGNWFSHD